MRHLHSFIALTALAFGSLLATASAPTSDPSALAAEGEDLYRKGAYAEALKKFEAAMAAGFETPALLYEAGNCYGRVLGNKDKELELKRKAIPPLEKEISGGTASVDSYYYLAAIYINDLSDPVKGTDVARKGVARLEKQKNAGPSAPDQFFRSGRLCTFLGKDAAAAGWYDRFIEAASTAAAPVDRAALRIALEANGAYRLRTKEFAAAVKAYEGLSRIDPMNDEVRHQHGRALLMAGRPDEAAKVWRGAHSDELRTELNYLAGVAEKYAALGQPNASRLAPKFSSLSDVDLQAKILEAGGPLREARQKEEELKRARDEKERADREAAENARVKDPNQIRAIFKAKRKGAPPPSDPNAAEAGAGDPWAALRNMGLSPATLPPPPPPSPEKVAAEKEFFVLLAEYVRRGHLIRNFCFENGLVEMIFR